MISLPSLIVAIPAVATRFADAFKFPNCEILTPGTKPVTKGEVEPPAIVVPNPTIAFLDSDVIGFDGKPATELLPLPPLATAQSPPTVLPARLFSFKTRYAASQALLSSERASWFESHAPALLPPLQLAPAAA
mgnify:CR=1 FL=1